MKHDPKYTAQVEKWDAAKKNMLEATWVALATVRDMPWIIDSVRVLDAMGYALFAVISRELITPEQFDAICRPWKQVMASAE